MTLITAAKHWPTPAMRDYKGTGNTIIRKDGKCRTDQLANASIYTGPLAPTILKDGTAHLERDQTLPPPSRRLNPRFVEWLMGKPIGWSVPTPLDQNDYQLWETESSRLLEQLQFRNYSDGTYKQEELFDEKR
jgi:hypothetical protein